MAKRKNYDLMHDLILNYDLIFMHRKSIISKFMYKIQKKIQKLYK